MKTPFLLLGLLVSLPIAAAGLLDQPAPARAEARGETADPDTDGDGLPDFQETHKYRTDPAKKDTADTGVADGDWQQRREFTYSVRAVIRVMPPYNRKALTDDYQDVRVLSETRDYAELEVIAYPLNSNAEAIEGNPNWKTDSAGMKEYLDPGVTTNWDARMQKDLLQELAGSGIVPDRLTDREVVEKVSRWLYSRSKHRSMFCTHYVAFRDGKPAVFPGLGQAFERARGSKEWSAQEQFAHELLGKEMFYRKSHGTCTSAAGLQATVLRALGIPARIIVAIPLVDPSDPEQVALAEKKLTHHRVRSTVTYGLMAAGQSYTAHTFLEVYVGKRWRRLNYTNLGQNILDPQYLGLMIHVHTFNDLAEANLAATWGARFALGKRDDVFRHLNPYRTLEVSDHFGRHARVANPPADKEHRHLTIGKVYWHDSKETPAVVRATPPRDVPAGAGRLFLHGEEWFADAGDYLQYRLFLGRADPNFLLRAPGQPEVKGRLSSWYITQASQDVREMELIVPATEYARMAKGVAYTLHPVNAGTEYRWKVKDGLTIIRQPTLEEKLQALQEKVEKLEKRLGELEKKGKGQPPGKE
jgi:hypothetical protein